MGGLFRNVIDNFNPAVREIMVFAEGLKLDEVEIMKKEEQIDSFNAMGRLYEEKAQRNQKLRRIQRS